MGVWLAPLLLLGWVVASSLGRTVVLRRADGRMHARPGTLMVLQAAAGGGAGGGAAACGTRGWWRTRRMRWGDRSRGAGAEPDAVLRAGDCADAGAVYGVGVCELGVGVAPLLAMLEDLGSGASLRAAMRLGPVRARLIEVNLVLGVVKIALMVLAMVFSATPLPFESVTTPEFSGVVVGGGDRGVSALVGFLPCGAAGGVS